MGRWIRGASALWTAVAAFACGTGAIEGSHSLGQYDYGTEMIPLPDAAYDGLAPQVDVTGEFLAPDMARAIQEHGGVSLDGSTYSEEPLGPCDFLGKGINCPPTWYFEQQVRILTRNRARDMRFTSEYSPSLSQQVGSAVALPRMGTKTNTFGAADGLYSTIGRHLARDAENRDHFGEFTYWGFQSWKEWNLVSGDWMSASRGSPAVEYTFGSLFSPFGPTANVFDSYVGGFNRAHTHYFEYYSQIHNWELNGRIRPRTRKDRLVLQPNGRWRREERPGPHYSFLYGLRVISINERSAFQSRGRIYSEGGSTPIYGDYHVRTGNNLVGLQIGGDMIHRYNKASWGFRGKVGPMINSAHHISEISSGGTDPYASVFPNDRLAASNSSIACVIEFGVTGRYMITPHFWLSAGYDLMWVTGLALAPEQMKFELDPSPKLNVGGTVFYHGLTAGFEWTF